MGRWARRGIRLEAGTSRPWHQLSLAPVEPGTSRAWHQSSLAPVEPGTELEDGAVGADRQRRIAATLLLRDLAACGPRAALEDARERQVGHGESCAHQRGQLVEQRERQRA